MIEVHLWRETWHLIEFPEQFVKRWERAKRRNRFFSVRYAGRRMYVNPRAIMFVRYGEGRP